MTKYQILNELKRLGYTKDQIDKMSANTELKIVKNNIKNPYKLPL